MNSSNKTAIRHPVMRYHGAKFRLASWIISFFPHHECYVEPFGGAAGVLMQKARSYAEVYNDLDGDIANVFLVLRDPPLREKLIDLCVMTPYSRDEFIKCNQQSSDSVEQARRTLFRAEAGFGSGGASGYNTGFRSDSKRAYSLAAHIWARYPERIAAFGSRLTGVIIENRPAIDVITRNNGPQTLFYVDPPYLHDTRKLANGPVYRHEMTDEQHHDLVVALLSVDGYVVLSGYDNELYNDMLPGWGQHSKSARISAGRGTGIRHEKIWINPACSDALGNYGRLL